MQGLSLEDRHQGDISAALTLASHSLLTPTTQCRKKFQLIWKLKVERHRKRSPISYYENAMIH